MKLEKTVRIFRRMPVLETERLILRAMSRSDSGDMYDYARREDVTKYLLWYPHTDLHYTAEYLKYVENRYKAGDFYDWAVVLKSNGKMIGTCGFTRIEHQSDLGEIGFVINPDYHGRGYATEAAGRVIKFGFEVLGLHRIEARFIQGNAASLAVQKRLGMKLEGYMRDAMIVKGEFRTIGVSALLAEENSG